MVIDFQSAQRKIEPDPRTNMSDEALQIASANAFPVVGNRVSGRGDTGLLTGCLCALLLGGVTFWTLSGNRKADVAPHAPIPVAAPVVEPAPVPVAPAPVTESSAMSQERLNAPALVVDFGPSINPVTSVSPDGAIAANAGQTLTSEESFAARIGGTQPDSASATRMRNPSSTVAQGAQISAVLETAINTDLPGYARAIVSKDVRAFDDSRTLVPRGSKLIGQYKGGLAAGQKRAYIVWTRLISPDGVSVALASPATDLAGQTGVAGKVDTHFLSRFGSAMLFTVVDAAAAVGGSAVVIAGGQRAGTALTQNDAAIPPTIKIKPGEPIRVFVARDLDFSSALPEVASR